MKIVASISNKLLGPVTGWVPWLAFLLIFGLSSHDHMPHGIHAWAQADRLAVTYSFYENGLDFSRPATYSLNSMDGRVGVEFPVVQYMAAAVAKLAGADYIPAIHRWINFVLLIGSLLFFAYSMANKRIRWLTVWLITLSPVLLYYAFNFLPDTSALAMCFFGFGYFLRSIDQQEKETKLRLFSLIFFALAGLFKATSGIYLLIFGGYYFFRSLYNKKFQPAVTAFIITVSLVFIIAVFDYLYVIRTNEKFWSVIFMSKSNPVTGPADIQSIYKGLVNWIPEYFSTLNGAFLILAVALVLIEMGTRRWTAGKSILFVLSFIGIIAVLYLFGRQFINHDYYFISSCYPLVSLLILYFITRGAQGLPGVFKPNLLWILLIIGTTFAITRKAAARGQDHYVTNDREFWNNVDWLRGGDTILDNTLNDERKSVVFVLYEDAPNLALLHFGRKGMTFNHEEVRRSRSPIPYWRERLNPDYFIVQNVWLSDLERDLLSLHMHLDTVLSAHAFTVFSVRNENNP